MFIAEYNIRVMLKEDSSYVTGKSNPKIGTEYECAGTIIEVRNRFNEPLSKQSIINQIENIEFPTITTLVVLWDNKSHNSYSLRTLSVIHEEIKQYKSIW